MWQREWCSRGKRAGEFCCGKICKVCGGTSGITACTSIYLTALGRTCHSALDVACLIPDYLPRRRGNHTQICATGVSEKLPMLARAFVTAAGFSRSTYSDMYRQAVVAWQDCVESMGGAFWELRLGRSDWPEMFLMYQASFLGSQNQLHVFVCAPGSMQHDQWMSPVPACGQVATLIREALPLFMHFWYHDSFAQNVHGRKYKGLLELPPPRGTALAVRGGEGEANLQLLWDLRARAVRLQLAHRPRSPRSPRRLRAAVCIAGLARSLSMPRVYNSIAANVTRTLGAETQTFYVLDLQGRPLHDFGAAWRAVPPDHFAFYDEPRGTWSNLPKCYWAPADNSHKLFAKFHTCLHMITEAEIAQRIQFDWVLRLRPDMEWLAPIGNLRNFEASSVYILRRKSYPNPSDTTDVFALVPRKHLYSYFGTSCPTLSDVRRAYKGQLCYGLSCNATDCYAISECVLQLRLAARSVPIVTFPPLMRVVREPYCRPNDTKCFAGWVDTFASKKEG